MAFSLSSPYLTYVIVRYELVSAIQIDFEVNTKNLAENDEKIDIFFLFDFDNRLKNMFSRIFKSIA